jgi:chitin disaccharide deacetylase
MLIINSDDFGRNRLATDNTLACFNSDRITSASAMMFMADSERAAKLALAAGLDVGLHLNFTLKFDGNVKSIRLHEYHRSIARFLLRNKYCHLLYNPLLRNQVNYVYEAQYEEYMRLYQRIPTHIDGHHHMHLSANILFGKMIPRGFKVRRSFSFVPGEKGLFNRLYRHILKIWLSRRYICTDLFFCISPIQPDRLRKIIKFAELSDVELMVHPERPEEYVYLMSKEYLEMISGALKGSYVNLKK